MGRSARRAVRSITRTVRSVTRSVERIVRGSSDVAGGIVDTILGTNITGNNTIPEMPEVQQIETPVTTTEVNQAITPEGSVTGKGQADLSDTGLGDVVSVFDMFSDQEDEMDILLGRKYNK